MGLFLLNGGIFCRNALSGSEFLQRPTVSPLPSNEPPEITGGEDFTTPVNLGCTVTGPVVGDADWPDTLTVTIECSAGTVSFPNTDGLTFSVGDGTADALMTFTGSIATINARIAEFDYQPASTGTHSITITVSDGIDEDFIIIAANVIAEDLPPTINGPTNANVYTGYDYSFSGSAISITDTGLSTTVVVINAGGGSATCTLASTAGLSFVQGDGIEDPSMQFSGSVADINAALNGLIFRTDINGSYDLIIEVFDDWSSDELTITCSAAEPEPS